MQKLSKPRQVTRFAPSPTGLLHIGHVFSALTAFHGRGPGGTFHLRIEDIDPIRCKDEYTDAIVEDLEWLGLDWETPIRKQSDHMADYAVALNKLHSLQALYRCFCSRSEIMTEIKNSGHAPHGPDGPIYPGTCRSLTNIQRDSLSAEGRNYAQRIDMQVAIARAGKLEWSDSKNHLFKAEPQRFGDVVLARKDIETSYHLAVTVDDQLQGITLVHRGCDLKPSTDVHRLLQNLLDYRTPIYDHHHLLTDRDGRRLSKRTNDITIRGLRDQGYSPDAVISLSGFDP